MRHLVIFSLIYKNGVQKTILANGNFKPKPNGIAIHPDGGWLITHLGDEDGGDLLLVGWGSTRGAIEEARKSAQRRLQCKQFAHAFFKSLRTRLKRHF